MLLAAQIIGIVVAAGVALYLLAVAFGLYVKARGQRPFDADALAAEGGKYATTSDGRVVEYFTYGTTNPDARVVVNMHGSGTEAREQARLNAPICEALGVRGIAISLPGFAYSDIQPGRQVKDWPRDDLEPVLAQEGVDRFMITGHSQGNPHAMAAAWYCGDRCEGLGLYAPLLPTPVSREEGVKGAIGIDALPTTEKLRKWYMGWYFTVMHLSVVTLAPWLPLKAIVRSGRKVREDAALLQHFGDSIVRGVVRGSVGNAWESAGDVLRVGFRPAAHRDTERRHLARGRRHAVSSGDRPLAGRDVPREGGGPRRLPRRRHRLRSRDVFARRVRGARGIHGQGARGRVRVRRRPPPGVRS